MRIFIHLIVLGLLSGHALSQVGIALDKSTRLKEEKEQLQLQSVITATFQANLGRGFELVSVIQTGSSFDNGYATWRNFDSNTSDIEAHLRRLLLQYANTGFQATLGFFGVRKTDGVITRLRPTGFIDGVRFFIPTLYGEVIVTLGSATDVETPDFFRRDFQFDYMEVVFKRELWQGANLELNVERIDGENFYREVLTHEFSDVLDRCLTIIVENIVDQERAAHRSGFSVIYDIDTRARPSQFIYRWIHQQEEYDNFRHGDMIDSLVGRKGTSSIIKYSAPVNDNVSWYLRALLHHSDSSLNRYDAGVGWRFKWNLFGR